MTEVLWHPFTQHGLEPAMPRVTHAKGAWLTLDNGQQVLDAISSWWINIHGHCHPQLIQALTTQAQQLDPVIFAGFTHSPGQQLAETLIHSLQSRGAPVQRCFYSDNGSTAVEVALKMAVQYWQINKQPKRQRFLALKHAYHGDTLGAMSVSARQSYHAPFQDLLLPTDFIDSNEPEQIITLLKQHPDQYAALIIEPMVQGAAGMRMYQAAALTRLCELAQAANILIIVDEIFTGFYRTGKLFGFEHAKLKPDMVLVSKALTGGMLPLAATLVTETIFQTFHSETINTAFLHGHSFTGNPIACQVALASWQLLHQTQTQTNIAQLCQATKLWIDALSQLPGVAEARALGTIGAIELVPELNLSQHRYWFRQATLICGVLLRPLGDVIYAVPPYCITASEVELIYSTLKLLVEKLWQKSRTY